MFGYFRKATSGIFVFHPTAFRCFMHANKLYNKTNIDFYFRWIRGYLDPPENRYSPRKLGEYHFLSGPDNPVSTSIKVNICIILQGQIQVFGNREHIPRGGGAY